MAKVSCTWTIDFELKTEIVKMAQEKSRLQHGKVNREESGVANEVIRKGLEAMGRIGNKATRLYECVCCGKFEAVDGELLCPACQEEAAQKAKKRLEEIKELEHKNQDRINTREENQKTEQIRELNRQLRQRERTLDGITGANEKEGRKAWGNCYKTKVGSLRRQIKTTKEKIKELETR
jgi:uncharacterized Zn finger protein (UPF0148 family)